MRHSRWQGAALSGRVSRSRAMPVGDRRSRPSEPPHLLGVRAETELSRRLGSAPLRPCGPLCRPEVGVPLPAEPSLPVGSAPRREPSRRLGFRPPRRCAPLCRAPPGGLPRGRRSLACVLCCPRGYGPRGEPSRRLGFRPPRPCAPARCWSETGAPGVSLLAAPPREAGGPGRRPPWGDACRVSSTPVGERTALPADRRRWRSPAAPRRSRSSRWSRCSGRSSRGSTG